MPRGASTKHMRPHNSIIRFGALLIFLHPVLTLAYSGYVKSVTVLAQGNSRVDWSWARNVILLDELGSNSYYGIYQINPDGTNQQCLTCTLPSSVASLMPKHKGNPEADPSGNWIIFQAEKAVNLGVISDYFANPGSGINNDIWIMDFAGQHFLQVTDTPVTQGGVLHPHFSHKGNQITWAQRYSSTGSPYGLWEIEVADFSVQNGNPVVTNIRTFKPGAQQQLYETHGFSPDDSKVIFSGNCQIGQTVYDTDIYTLDLSSGQLTDLTSDINTPPTQWNEHAHYSPTGNQIFWMTSDGTPRTDLNANGVSNGQVKTDFWVMYPPNGASKLRLTYFNDPTAPEYIAGATHVTCGDSAWNAAGTSVVATLITSQSSGLGEVVVLNFDWSSAHLSAASFQSGLAPGSIATAFGRGLVSDEVQTPLVETTNATSPPPTLSGTTINITDSAGMTRPAALFVVSHGQVNYVIPADTAPGPATAQVVLNNPAWTGTDPNIPGPSSNLVVSTANIQIGSVAPGIFTANQNGSGVPSAYTQTNNSNGSQTVQNVFQCNSSGLNCQPASIVLTSSGQTALDLFATGIRNAHNVEVTIGGEAVQVLYTGPQKQYAGLDQVVVLLPTDFAGMGNANVVVTGDGVDANPVSIAFH